MLGKDVRLANNAQGGTGIWSPDGVSWRATTAEKCMALCDKFDDDQEADIKCRNVVFNYNFLPGSTLTCMMKTGVLTGNEETVPLVGREIYYQTNPDA